MRFEQLRLLRYGHFSGRCIEFPKDDGHDFQLVLGPNEAGKSTLRRAFRDLLFGIPMDTPMSFLHPGSELELAGRLSGGPGELEFGRRRKRNGGLVDAAGNALPAERLHPWLGEVNEAFYERMFGLDHRRLEAGARAMLQASDSVDSVLFQAAAGVSALNEVLEALRAEANTLWAPRRSRERAWYVAADRLAEAETMLKAATVRPTAWAEAHKECARLEEAFAGAETRHAELLAEVRELERLRRLAPLLAQIRQHEALLDEGETGGTDAVFKEHAAEIVRLDAMRLRVADYGVENERCRSRGELLWQQLAQVLRDLGREAPHAGGDLEPLIDQVAASLPSRPVRREVEQLLSEGAQLRTHAEAAQRALAERQQELTHLQAEMAAVPLMAASADLEQAVDAAGAAGDLDARVSTLRGNLDGEEAALRRGLAALSQAGIAVPAGIEPAVEWLAHMRPWPTAHLLEEAQRRQRLHNEYEILCSRVRDAELECAAARLEVEQFNRTHRAVTRDEVVAARRERDALWQAMATGERSLEEARERYVTLVRGADTLADLQLAAVDDAARLQTLQHELERRERGLQGLQAALMAAENTCRDQERSWASACEQRALPALAPAALQEWQTARESVLSAHERWCDTEARLKELDAQRTALMQQLVSGLQAEAGTGGHAANTLTVQSLRAEALRVLQRVRQAQARRDALAEQGARLAPLIPGLQAESHRLAAALTQWRARWQSALERASLPVDAHEAFVESALGLLEDAEGLTSSLREVQAERRRMQAELLEFAAAARRVAEALNDRDFDDETPDTHVRRWAAEAELVRQRERLREDARRRLAELTDRLLQEGEGRTRQAIEAELEGADVTVFAARSDALSAALEEAAAARSALAVECEQARKALEAISGSDEAAQAEARRQEALADMAEVAERYVRLYAEYRLLERVTERYRERRQGPLLARAGQLFADLTLDAHAGLVVDSEAAVLQARRADGGLVPLEGLSEGTRDQLYLALRLAALDLYLNHAAPMPFIADDLFVNYDDERAVAGLRKLGALSSRTQVVFLTHHAHMVELAERALEGRMQLVEL